MKIFVGQHKSIVLILLIRLENDDAVISTISVFIMLYSIFSVDKVKLVN